MSGLEIIQILGAIGEFVGAIAVVVTLIYLAVQVRHSSKVAQAAAVEAGRTRRVNSFEGLRDSPYLPVIQAKLVRGEALDEEEEIRLAAHNASVWGLLYAEWVQRDLGMMGEYATQAKMGLALALNSVTAMKWWELVGTQIYPPRFVEFVQQAIGHADSADSRERIADAGFLLDSR